MTSTPIGPAPVAKTPVSAFASKVKLTESLNLKQFDLINDDPSIWIAGFEAAAKKHGSLEEMGLALMFHLLDDDCLSWHFKFRRTNQIFVWSNYKDEFVEEMNKRFLTKLSILKKKFATGTYSEYVNEQIEIHKLFFPNLADNELILICLAGLPNAAQNELNEFKSVSLKSFQNFCSILDKEKSQTSQQDS